MMDYQYKIRAHHGMCLAFFRGKGYSPEFTAHMTLIQNAIAADPLVCILKQADEICSACPNLQENVCIDSLKVVKYDQKVLQYCNLTPGQVLPLQEFMRLVRRNILDAGIREEICGDCMWSAICHF